MKYFKRIALPILLLLACSVAAHADTATPLMDLIKPTPIVNDKWGWKINANFDAVEEEFADRGVNVKWFGALGNGVHDDTAAITAAALFAQQTGTGTFDGRPLYFPPGSYAVSTLKDCWHRGSIEIIGAGKSNVRIFSTTGQTVFDFSNLATLRYLKISGMTISGGLSMPAEIGSAHGIHLATVSGFPYSIELEHLVINNFSGNAVHVPTAFNISLKFIDADRCKDDLIYLRGRNSTLLQNVYVHNIADGRYGFNIHGGYTVFLSCVGIDGCWDNPTSGVVSWARVGRISEYIYGRCQFIGCQIEDFNGHGVLFERGSWGNFLSTIFYAMAGATNAIALYFDHVYAAVPQIDSTCRFTGKAGFAWANGSPIHVDYGLAPIMWGGNWDGNPSPITQFYSVRYSQLQDLARITAEEDPLGGQALRISGLSIDNLWSVDYRHEQYSPVASKTPRSRGELFADLLSGRFFLSLAGAKWAAATEYGVGDTITSSGLNGYSYACTVAGTSDASTEPTWPTTIGSTVTDGTVTWRCIGSDWVPINYVPRSGVGSPIGSITPRFPNEPFHATQSGLKIVYVAHGATNNDWTQVSIPRSSAAPASGEWVAGQCVHNSAPASGQPQGWCCSLSGEPGTWLAMPNFP